ncbi:hypothetical protein KCP74_16615 [Salmonella enterica subsp. enterica]|nr:hypothetical protein KCP74_16615 [Salmonella enterica subsp. enterica]
MTPSVPLLRYPLIIPRRSQIFVIRRCKHGFKAVRPAHAVAVHSSVKRPNAVLFISSTPIIRSPTVTGVNTPALLLASQVRGAVKRMNITGMLNLPVQYKPHTPRPTESAQAIRPQNGPQHQRQSVRSPSRRGCKIPPSSRQDVRTVAVRQGGLCWFHPAINDH